MNQTGWPGKLNREHWLLVGVLAMAVALRVGVALYYGNLVPTAQDDQSYSELGWRVANGYGFSFDRQWYPFTPADTPTAHWSFLYTLLVALVYGLVGFQPVAVRMVGALLGGVLLPLATFRLTRELIPGRKEVALTAAGLAAVYAFFVMFAGRILTETFYIIALLWSLERALVVARGLRAEGRLSWWPALSLGLSLGLATLFRQAILPWVLLLFAWLLWVGLRSRSLRAAALTVGLATVVIGLLVLPFTARNYQVYGDFLLLNSNAGFAMYSAQHPMHGISFREHEAAPLPRDLREEQPPLTEAEWDRALMGRGIGFALSEPGRYALLSLSRLADYFEFWPTDTTLLHNGGRLASFTLFLPFMAAGLWLAGRQAYRAVDRKVSEWTLTPYFLALLFIVSYSLLHILTWAMPRYRLPVDAVALPYAALALVELATLIKRRRDRGWKQRSIEA